MILVLRESIELCPHCFINVEVNENFDMQDTFGLIRIRSSLSRRGIFLSSGIYDPGFKGVGGVTLYNFSDDTINIAKYTRIGQMIVFQANSAKKYNGFYNQNKTIKSQYEGDLNEQI